MEIGELTRLVKSNKKYRDISDEVVKTKVEEYISKNNGFDEKIAIKEIRKDLRRVHSSFRMDERKIKEYLEEKDWKSILKTNKSTEERLDIYGEIYEKIFETTGKPTSILDLGCGLNPVSIPFMNLDNEKIKYYGYDINEAEVSALNDFFSAEKIDGKAEVLDLTRIDNVKKLPNTDVCLMLKLVDILETRGHKYSEEMIKILVKKCNYIVVSFATQTLGGRKMKFAERGWIERMLERIGFGFKKIVFDGEIFYVVRS